jgi:hypothetical protein
MVGAAIPATGLTPAADSSCRIVLELVVAGQADELRAADDRVDGSDGSNGCYQVRTPRSERRSPHGASGIVFTRIELYEDTPEAQIGRLTFQTPGRSTYER